MKVGSLVRAKWLDQSLGIVIDVVFDEYEVAYSYRVKWFVSVNDQTSPHETREYAEDLVLVCI